MRVSGLLAALYLSQWSDQTTTKHLGQKRFWIQTDIHIGRFHQTFLRLFVTLGRTSTKWQVVNVPSLRNFDQTPSQNLMKSGPKNVVHFQPPIRSPLRRIPRNGWRGQRSRDAQDSHLVSEIISVWNQIILSFWLAFLSGEINEFTQKKSIVGFSWCLQQKTSGLLPRFCLRFLPICKRSKVRIPTT